MINKQHNAHYEVLIELLYNIKNCGMCPNEVIDGVKAEYLLDYFLSIDEENNE